jgi:hypothetical protein
MSWMRATVLAIASTTVSTIESRRDQGRSVFIRTGLMTTRGMINAMQTPTTV